MTAICLLWISGSSSLGQSRISTTMLTSLVEAERAFARTSVEKGVRQSFMEYFADDAIVFRPHPVRYKEAMRDVPTPKNPLDATLNWKPLYADISLAGDLGYTTGPYVWKDNTQAGRPTRYGFYFSVWKVQPDGGWKVVFDGGCETPGPYEDREEFQPAVRTSQQREVKSRTPGELRTELMEAERNFRSEVSKRGIVDVLGEFVSPQARVYRQNGYPIIGSDSIRAYFSLKSYLSTWDPLQCDIAVSGDLGYVYGSYEVQGAVEGSTGSEKGYYVRVWKQNAQNRWMIVHEVTSPLPPEAAKPKK
jgi:ketosteroid isomerase-like protein